VGWERCGGAVSESVAPDDDDGFEGAFFGMIECETMKMDHGYSMLELKRRKGP
jgi:hypothetical protein